MQKRKAGAAPAFSSAAGWSLHWVPGSTLPVAPRTTPGFDSRCGIFWANRLDAALYIWLGLVFSDRVQAVGALLGDLTWAVRWHSGRWFHWLEAVLRTRT